MVELFAPTGPQNWEKITWYTSLFGWQCIPVLFLEAIGTVVSFRFARSRSGDLTVMELPLMAPIEGCGIRRSQAANAKVHVSCAEGQTIGDSPSMWCILGRLLVLEMVLQF
jgi:hypothetical protein